MTQSSKTSNLSAATLRYLKLAGTALGQGKLGDAESAALCALALAPGAPEAHRLMGIVELMRGEPRKAACSLELALQQTPDDPQLLMNLGSALYDSGDHEAGIRRMRMACEAAPSFAAAWYNLGKALKQTADLDGAMSALIRCLAIDRTHALARICLADALTETGRIVEAVAQYREVLGNDAENAHAWYALADLKTEPFTEKDVALLRRALGRSGLSPERKIMLGYALYKALEDLASYQEAFDALSQANRVKRGTLSWDSAREASRIRSIAAAFSTPPMTPLDPQLGRDTIFIASLPRSGSTLIEQILASHPQVEGANEINDLAQVLELESSRLGRDFTAWAPSAGSADWHRLGLDYLQRTQRWREGKPISVDKNLDNWEFVGAISRMLPAARIIICIRDPMETCFSCYRQLFSDGAHFSYDLREMASRYEDFAYLARHWLGRLQAHCRLQSYDALVANPEAEIRELLEFCGLPFHSACLEPHKTERRVRSTASAAQVRLPFFQGRSKSEIYRHQLAGLQESLREIPPIDASA